MPRPKGSKNTAKKEVKKEVKKAAVKPSAVSSVCSCGHERSNHYDGPEAAKGGWCHSSGCLCQYPQ
jgi:hypothetical protein